MRENETKVFCDLCHLRYYVESDANPYSAGHRDKDGWLFICGLGSPIDVCSCCAGVVANAVRVGIADVIRKRVEADDYGQSIDPTVYGVFVEAGDDSPRDQDGDEKL